MDKKIKPTYSHSNENEDRQEFENELQGEISDETYQEAISISRKPQEDSKKTLEHVLLRSENPSINENPKLCETKNLNKEDLQIDTEFTPQISASKEYELEELRLTQDFENLSGTKKIILSVAVRRPDKQWWFQVHPGEEWRTTVAIIEIRDERESYIIIPRLLQELDGECASKLLVTCITKDNTPFIWPIRLPGHDGKWDFWNKSAMSIVAEYPGRWIRLRSNQVLGGYEALVSENDFSQPVWPQERFTSLFKKAFRGKIIDSLEHPVIKRLRG